MNPLNSILLEGNAGGEPGSTPQGVVFDLVHRRLQHDSSQTKSVFQILCKGRLGVIVLEQLHAGRGVRVVGMLEARLRPSDELDFSVGPAVYVLAEHIEFKPERKEAPTGSNPQS